MSNWKSPLEGYEDAEPLPNTVNSDGKSLFNPPGTQSTAYEVFPAPIDSSNNRFDFHVYYMPTFEAELKFARQLHERIRREFPELRIYKFWEKPVGPHPTAMFEINTFTPHQTGALFSWLTVHRGPCSYVFFLDFCVMGTHQDDTINSHAPMDSDVLATPWHSFGLTRSTHFICVFVAFQIAWFMIIYSVLVHPNTDDELKDHTELMSWMGKPWPLNTSMLG